MPDDSHIIEELANFFSDPALKSSVRLLIVISLALNGRMSFTELLQLTGTGKGSLTNHLEKLRSSDCIVIREYSLFSSRRVSIELTEGDWRSTDSMSVQYPGSGIWARNVLRKETETGFDGATGEMPDPEPLITAFRYYPPWRLREALTTPQEP